MRTMPVLRLPKFGKPVKYAYITGRVRAMKTKLIPAEMYPRMMAMDVSEIARYLEETQYKDEIDALSKDYSGMDLTSLISPSSPTRTRSYMEAFRPVA